MKQMERATAEAMHWPILEPVDADGQVNPIALNKPVCVAGDRTRVNLPLHSPQISRAHALFVADADGVYLRDLASLNGVRVNDNPVREAVLHNGDVVGLGPFLFRCLKNFPQPQGAAQPHRKPAELRLTQTGARIPLTSRTLLIGSREECDVHVSDAKVSPAHAVIFERDGRRFVRDLRSVSGTQVNGQQVGEIELHPGDSIQVGETTLSYAPSSDAPAQAPSDESMVEALVESPLDEVSLSADDSMIAMTELPGAKVETPQGTFSVPMDSAIIPLMEENPETPNETRQASRVPAAMTPASAVVEPSRPSGPADSAVIPIISEAEDVPSPDEHPQATAAELLEEHDHTPDAAAGDEESPRGLNAHPGTVDRRKAEEVFSELLDDLAENVEQVQTVWEDLKTSAEEPTTAYHPGTELAADKSAEAGADDRGRRKSIRDAD